MKSGTTEATKDTEAIRTGASVRRTLVRWVRFNAVGAVGMVVQLGALAILNRMMAGHYLVATALAIEVTLVHNFAWHVHYTWRDRRGKSAMVEQFVRFSLSNGLVSMAGNLALMPVLVGAVRMPVLTANGVAILACSILNFCLGDRWVFAGEAKRARQGQRSQPPAQSAPEGWRVGG